ncbi:hypothetical protein DPSP01_003253 [Paraphaeosphaeria sporulosa]|uniref:Uncharacterized protein n=1 Tax=Paraphaeosphaeria sporulosa TaxID=1460663 RepID=A0A177CYF7_9PLEO|nr:uncharacterized protein CC84DRAFT_65750 [Paraphaeosphaeria sporulosa]OAG12068.1 hypothetical protein CC84DRAFT_65750 [Paraphaeosphaeria sporulosa]
MERSRDAFGVRCDGASRETRNTVKSSRRCKSVAARRPLVDARASISRGAPANPPGLGVNSETQKASGWASGWASCNATLAAASGPCVQARGGERDCPTRRQSQLDSSLTWKRTPRPQVFQSGPAVQLSSVSWLLLYCVCFSGRGNQSLLNFHKPCPKIQTSLAASLWNLCPDVTYQEPLPQFALSWMRISRGETVAVAASPRMT